MSTGRGVSSFYSSSRDNDARSDVYTPTRQPQTRSPLQPLQMNRQARSGYLPGMGLADIASQEENFSQQDCFSSLQAERGRDDMFLLENTPPQGCLSQPSFRPAVSGESGIMSMLQRQQGVLEQVLQGQKTLQEQQERLEQRLESLEDQAAQATSSSDSTSCTKKKRIVTRELSVCTTLLLSFINILTVFNVHVGEGCHCSLKLRKKICYGRTVSSMAFVFFFFENFFLIPGFHPLKIRR